MSRGSSVDYGIVSPSHMSNFSPAAPLMDMPFLFRDLDHWNKVLDSNAFQPIADEVSEKADVQHEYSGKQEVNRHEIALRIFRSSAWEEIQNAYN